MGSFREVANTLVVQKEDPDGLGDFVVVGITTPVGEDPLGDECNFRVHVSINRKDFHSEEELVDTIQKSLLHGILEKVVVRVNEAASHCLFKSV